MGLSQDLMAPKHFEGWMIKVEFAQVQTGCPPRQETGCLPRHST